MMMMLYVISCLLQQHDHDDQEFIYGDQMVGGVTRATIERNTYPHKYKRVTNSLLTVFEVVLVVREWIQYLSFLFEIY